MPLFSVLKDTRWLNSVRVSGHDPEWARPRLSSIHMSIFLNKYEAGSTAQHTSNHAAVTMFGQGCRHQVWLGAQAPCLVRGAGAKSGQGRSHQV